MSRYESASHVFYRCQYHLVWTPKYRYKILKGNLDLPPVLDTTVS